MVDHEEKMMRKRREREKTIEIAQKRNDKLAEREEKCWGRYLTDNDFAYPHQKGRKNFSNSANGKRYTDDV